jgi:hypothetical protein
MSTEDQTTLGNCLPLFVGELMCVFVYSVIFVLFVFALCLVNPKVPVFLACPFLDFTFGTDIL